MLKSRYNTKSKCSSLPSNKKADGQIYVEKSIYDSSSTTDGVRILVMRMWPRGIKKSKIDAWMKDLGTEKDLIKEWRAGKLPLQDFRSRYISNLKKSKAARDEMDQIIDLLKHGKNVTLLCTDRDVTKCHRSSLKQILEERL